MPTFTTDDLLTLIAERTKAGEVEWMLTATGRIRTKAASVRERRCPLEYWTGDSAHYDETAVLRGMSPEAVADVIDAVDMQQP